MAYEITAGVAIFYLALFGVVAWFRLNPNWDYSSVDRDPFFGQAVFFENHIAIPMFWYQSWNVVLCLALQEFRDPTMIAHHVVTALLAYLSLNPYLQYYGIFFFGLPEVTSVPLTFVDIFKMFPELQSKYPTLNSISRWTFGVLFILVRIIYWPIVSYSFWTGSISIIATKRSHSLPVTIIYLLANIFMTGLQFFWGSKIVSSMLKSAKSDKKKVK
jgi:hypothetical protein